MSNHLPNISRQHRVCIICEGFEEYEYLYKLKSLKVWNKCYSIEPVNAESNGNIFARYQDKYQNAAYDVVLVFCDTDKKPYEQYGEIKDKINKFHGLNDASDKVVIFANPCTMQIIILHFENVILPSHKKNKNADIIKRNTGIENYKAREDQRKLLFGLINAKNYYDMKDRCKELSVIDSEKPSSNFGLFIHNFAEKDIGWINSINDALTSN